MFYDYMIFIHKYPIVRSYTCTGDYQKYRPVFLGREIRKPDSRAGSAITC